MVRGINLQLFAEEETQENVGESQEPEQVEQEEQGKGEETSETTEKTNGETEEKTFTQAELEEIIAKRLERERKKYSDYDDLKTKVTEAEKQLEEKRLAEMSEKERAEELAKRYEQEKTELEQQLENIKQQAQREKVNNEFIKLANKYNVAYVDDALKLADFEGVNVDEEGKLHGVEEVVKALVKEKPFLVQKDQPKQIGGGTKKTQDDKTAESKLKELADRARKTGKIEDRVAYSNLKRELGV